MLLPSAWVRSEYAVSKNIRRMLSVLCEHSPNINMSPVYW